MAYQYETFTVPTERFENILPEIFERIDDKFRHLIDDIFKDIYWKDYQKWYEDGAVKIVLEDGVLKFWPVWEGKSYPDNVVPWITEELENIETERMVRIFYFWDFWKT